MSERDQCHALALRLHTLEAVNVNNENVIEQLMERLDACETRVTRRPPVLHCIELPALLR